jgi:hypothetical protein
MHKDMPDMTAERGRFDLTTAPVNGDPLWSHPALSASSTWIDFRIVNAIWQSAATDTVFDKQDNKSYYKLCFALHNSWPSTNDWYESDKHLVWYEPQIFAKALSDFKIALGTVFDDDHETILWPLGKGGSSLEHRLLLYCAHPHYSNHDCGGYNWRYRPIVSMGSAYSGLVGLSEKGTNTLDTPVVVEAASPVGRPQFLALPAELRNKIFIHYLNEKSDNSKMIDWRGSFQRVASLSAPDLAMVNRQLLEEVTPLWMASRTISVSLRTWRNYNNRPSSAWLVLDDRNYWVSHLINTAHVRRANMRLQ